MVSNSFNLVDLEANNSYIPFFPIELKTALIISLVLFNFSEYCSKHRVFKVVNTFEINMEISWQSVCCPKLSET